MPVVLVWLYSGHSHFTSPGAGTLHIVTWGQKSEPQLMLEQLSSHMCWGDWWGAGSLATEWFVTILWLIWLQLSRTRTRHSDKRKTMHWRKVPKLRICFRTGLIQKKLLVGKLEHLFSGLVQNTLWGQAAWRIKSSKALPPPPPPPLPCLWTGLRQARQPGREGATTHSTTSRLAALHGKEGKKFKIIFQIIISICVLF